MYHDRPGGPPYNLVVLHLYGFVSLTRVAFLWDNDINDDLTKQGGEVMHYDISIEQ